MTKQKDFKVVMTDEDILASVKEYTDNAKQYYIDNIKSKFKDLINAYNGEIKDFEKLYSMPDSSFISRDIAVTVHTVLPDIQKLVFTDEPVTLTPQGAEDVEKAQRVQALLNYQVTKQNNYSRIMEKIAIDALITGTAFLKCEWKKEFETEEFIEELTADKVRELEDKGYKVDSQYIGSNEKGDIYKATYKADKVIKDQPVYERVPYYELYIDPTADEMHEANYIIHRRLVNLDYLRREEAKGNYYNIDELLKDIKDKQVYYVNNYDDDDEEKYIKVDKNKNNIPLNNIMIYEFWGKLDINEDGFLENVIITYTGDFIISIEENTYKEYPFFAFTPLYKTNKIYGLGVAEFALPGQMIKTTLMRELLINTKRNNDRKSFYKQDDFIDPEQLATNEKYVAIRAEADINKVFAPEPFEPISPAIQNIIAYIDRDIQQATGISEAKQGVKSNGNQTATEATIQYEAANSKIQEIALHFADTLKDLYKFLLYQNQRFLTNTTQVRLFNNIIDITADDVQDINYDIQVSATFGNGTQQTRQATYNNALSILLNIAQPMSLTNPIKIRNLIAKILEESGLKDIDNYIISEQEATEKYGQMELQGQLMQAMAMQGKGLNYNSQQTGPQQMNIRQPLENMKVK